MMLPRQIERDGQMGPNKLDGGWQSDPCPRRLRIRRFRRVSKMRVRELYQLTITDYGPHAFGHLDCTSRELAQFNFDTPWIRETCDCGDPEHDDPRDCILNEDGFDWQEEYSKLIGRTTE